MRIDSRFTAIARDPVLRLARVHQQSLNTLRRNRPAPPNVACASAAHGTAAEQGQCRIIVNALRREIDRLLRGHFALEMSFPHWLAHRSVAARSVRADSEAAPAARRVRSPFELPPVGRIPLRSARSASAAVNMNRPVGTVIDLRG